MIHLEGNLYLDFTQNYIKGESLQFDINSK